MLVGGLGLDMATYGATEVQGLVLVHWGWCHVSGAPGLVPLPQVGEVVFWV